MHTHLTLGRVSKWLAIVALATLLGWAGWERAGSAQAGQADSTRAAQERARAERKGHQPEWQADPQDLLQPVAQATTLVPDGALVPEVEPNDTVAQAMTLTPATSPAIVVGAVTPGTDRDFFKFDAPAGAKLWAYVDTGGTQNLGATSRNSLLTLYAANGTTVIEQDDDDGTGNGCDGTQETALSSAIAGRTLTAGGTYYLRVQQTTNNGVIDPYQIYVALTNTAPVAESEPNNTSAQANPIIAAGETVGLRSGAIGSAGDLDFYSVVANANDILYISSDDDPERDGSSNDSVVQLLSPTGTVLLTIDNSDDTGFPAPPAEAACFLIQSAGTYFVRVRHFVATGTGTYNLMVAVAGQRRTDCGTVTALNPASGAPGTSVTLTGTNLTGVTGVIFPNNVTASFTVVSDTLITTTVPAGAVTGQIIFNKANCPPARTPYFVVPGTNCPTVNAAVSPNSGVAGTNVSITGANLTGVTAVRFANNVNANFTVVSDTTISATVPAGAVTGPISIVRADCPVAQTGGFTIGAGQDLAVDDGSFETSIGLTAGGTDYAVNRLTPTSYPATLSRLLIYFAPGRGVQVGMPFRLLVGTSPGGTDINNTQFQITQATVQALDQFNVFTVPAITITSGDFVVGFSMTYPAGTFPTAIDRTPPSQMRSYVSSNGTTFTLIDTASPSLAGNFGIRARLVTSLGTFSSVSAASFSGTELGRDSILAGFGVNLATATQVANTTPLPTTLANTTVKVRDSAGTERLAPLFFVSSGQINYLLPAGTATGAATITVTSGDGSVSRGTAQIAAVAPGLFSANASGSGVAAAVVLRRNAAGQDTFEPVARLDGSAFVPVPIDLGPATDQVFLILYGTGIRGRSALSAVTAKIGGTDVPVLFAGEAAGFAGLDQVNLGPLPRSLAGRGVADVVLMVDGKTANTVTVTIR